MEAAACGQPGGDGCRRLVPAALAASLLLLAPAEAAERREATSADDLLIVDCLLPPQVRRLGRRASYLAARQPIKATAIECRIRGGEYTEPDQANLGTALKVWLPQAEAGEAEAQYAVGQIFEKGLGLPPDFAAAAEWYRRAAEQGHAAAQIGLGSLYETGRGVAQDAQEALRWYRRAAGLAEDLVVLQGEEYEALSEAQQELETAREELEERARQVEELEREVEELESRPPPPPPPGPGRAPLAFGRYHALVIGNGAYSALPPLATAVADARAVAGVLASRYGFEVQLLLDATRFDIMRALNGLRESLDADDNLLVYYAGHARRDPGAATAYWQPVDAEPANPANWIPSELVSEHLDLVPARHVLVVADAAFSGLRTRSSIAQLPQGMTEEERYYAIRVLLDKRCRLVLTSGRPGPQPAAAGGTSPFAAALIEALRRNDGVLASSSLYAELNRQLTSAPDSAPLELAAMQWARGDVSEFFFVHRPS